VSNTGDFLIGFKGLTAAEMGKLPGTYTPLSPETSGTYDDRLEGEGFPRAFAKVESPARMISTDIERLNSIALYAARFPQ
jgi:hypothetical protein